MRRRRRRRRKVWRRRRRKVYSGANAAGGGGCIDCPEQMIGVPNGPGKKLCAGRTRGEMEDMCRESRTLLAAACMDESGHLAL